MSGRPNIRNSTILVTGGAGFIGSHLVDRLIASGAKGVIVVDNMFLGNEGNLSGAFEQGARLYREDAEILSSLEYVFEQNTIDLVFNCATKPLNYSFVNPANAYMTNVVVLNHLLELQRKRTFRTLCHFSTSEVFGTAVYEPMDEKHPLGPTTTYASGKAAADLMLQTYVKMFDLDAFIVRPFNNYGPRQNHSGYLAGVIPITISRILKGECPEIHGTGRQVRDFIHVHDTVDAIVRVFDKLPPGESINISADGMIAIREVIEKITKVMHYSGKIVERDARKADVACHRATNAKLKGLIPFSPRTFDSGLAETVDWYREFLTRRT